MKNYTLSIMLVIILLLAGGVLSADSNSRAGRYGYKFLTVPYGPVSLALGGRGVQSADNVSAFIIQPAALCEYDNRAISLAHTAWLVDTQANCLAYSYARRTNHFGITLRNLDSGELENRDDTGFLIGYYNPLDIDVLANYAYRINPSLYCGVNIGLLYQKLHTASSLGLHGDLGLSLLPPLKGAKLSLAVKNLGNANKTNEENVRFPTSLEADYTHSFSLGDQQIAVGGAAIKMRDEDIKGSLSAELELLKLLKLRAAYKFNYSAENLSAGFGLNYKKISVDYGYASYSDELTDVHSFGLGYRF